MEWLDGSEHLENCPKRKEAVGRCLSYWRAAYLAGRGGLCVYLLLLLTLRPCNPATLVLPPPAKPGCLLAVLCLLTIERTAIFDDTSRISGQLPTPSTSPPPFSIASNAAFLDSAEVSLCVVSSIVPIASLRDRVI